MSTNRRAWLSPQGYEQIRHELDRLLLSHRSDLGRLDGGVEDDAWVGRQWRERQIRHLQELLLTADVGEAPPDDGIAEAGMVVTVRFGDSAETETCLLADGDAPASAGMDVYSSASPIGRALWGAAEGDTRGCSLPDGRTISVTLVTARPYHHVSALGAEAGHGRAPRERQDHAQ